MDFENTESTLTQPDTILNLFKKTKSVRNIQENGECWYRMLHSANMVSKALELKGLGAWEHVCV